jgi:hypothetical protein
LRHHAVDNQAREHQRCERESGQQRRMEARLPQRRFDNLRHRLNLVERLIAIDSPRGFADAADQARARSSSGPCSQSV